MILVLDNYDSFTFNIVRYLRELDLQVSVVKSDRVTLADIDAFSPSAVLLSPGPGTPSDAGVSVEAVKAFAGKLPIFGICLGLQCIVEAFGGEVVRATKVMHGKTSLIHHSGKGVFEGLPVSFRVARYHSLLARQPLPCTLELTAETDGGELMGLRHRDFPIEGVQFHPEAVLSEQGHALLGNFFKQ